ncbi:TSUP family transporter [Litorivicinus lipolyticus]|uniref:Probable membrane transporter protein n=1 Tax=Litorivicinus lipolyticus TaxID=418701 RepID=A0A5Q2Q9N8_9GAMM|nr:sulfite exporter TauE/SafE family protein [Litorivicinus lipolyticus]QGG79893.1 TSUP family transporter [Litorivicinus lipolyticus]
MDLVWLAAAAVVSATITGAMGVGGGLVLIVLMAQFVPPIVLIPLHAFVMLMSNTGRAWIQRKHVRWAYVWPFLAGSVVGVVLMAPLVRFMPTTGGQLLLGLFVIGMTWRPQWFRLQAWLPALSGALTSALTMVLGATGPLVMSVLPKANWPKREIVGTHGMVMTFQHGLKAAAFWWMGFDPIDWGSTLLAMGAGSVVGNVLGARLLGRIPEANFKRALDWLLTLLALRLIAQALV